MLDALKPEMTREWKSMENTQCAQYCNYTTVTFKAEVFSVFICNPWPGISIHTGLHHFCVSSLRQLIRQRLIVLIDDQAMMLSQMPRKVPNFSLDKTSLVIFPPVFYHVVLS